MPSPDTFDDYRRRQIQEALQRGLQRPRQPMDERLPSGETPGDLVSRIAKRPEIPANTGLSLPPLAETANKIRAGNAEYDARAKVAGAMSYPEWQDAQRTGKIPVWRSHLGNDVGLSVPQPTIPSAPRVDPTGVPPPNTQPLPERPSPRIGYSTEGLTGVDALRQRRKALEEADPESQVTSTGEILPPQKTGRWKGLGQGALLGAGQADPDRPMYGLGQLLGGAVTGVVSPRSSAKGMRRFELDQLDNDLARGLKLEQQQAETDRVRNPMGQMSTRVVGEGEFPGIEAGTEIRVRIDPRTGAVTDVVGPNQKPVISDTVKRAPQGAPHYESDADGNLISIQGGRAQKVTDDKGQPIKVRSKNASGEVVEVEVNGQTLRVTPGQALDYYGQIGARADRKAGEDRERESRYTAAKSEYDSLVTAEEDARKAKEDAYKTLDSMRKSNQPKEDIEQADQAAKAADAFYRTFGEKKKDAGRRMLENQAPATQPSGGVTLQGAIDAFKQQAKRDPTAAEIENIKKYYGLQ